MIITYVIAQFTKYASKMDTINAASNASLKVRVNSLDETLIGATLGIFVALFLSFRIFKLGIKLNLRNFFFFT